ncbi:MAG: hypothetical protein IPK65_11935 [Gammaproteobacteria bacterium]|nr:hypothetical protein [Gammaproteobacteria bacterium]
MKGVADVARRSLGDADGRRERRAAIGDLPDFTELVEQSSPAVKSILAPTPRSSRNSFATRKGSRCPNSRRSTISAALFLRPRRRWGGGGGGGEEF